MKRNWIGFRISPPSRFWLVFWFVSKPQEGVARKNGNGAEVAARGRTEQSSTAGWSTMPVSRRSASWAFLAGAHWALAQLHSSKVTQSEFAPAWKTHCRQPSDTRTHRKPLHCAAAGRAAAKPTARVAATNSHIGSFTGCLMLSSFRTSVRFYVFLIHDVHQYRES